MNEQAVRTAAESFAATLLAGDIDAATAALSRELRSNMGEVVMLLPLPLTETAVESVEAAGSGYLAVLRLVGEKETVRLQTRWKERDGEPTIVEVSHIAEPVPQPGPEETPEASG